MKLCFIMYQGNMYSGGQGVYLHYLTREMVRAGHEVHVISGRPYPTLADGVVHHRLHTYSMWAFLDGRDEQAYTGAPFAFLHPFNFYEFASTRASSASTRSSRSSIRRSTCRKCSTACSTCACAGCARSGA